jgi:hypothetical protein
VRETWARHLAPSQSLFLVEGGHARSAVEGDTLRLAVPDGYAELARKTHHMIAWSLEHLECDAVLKCDDDTYLHAGRIAAAAAEFGDYRGHPADDQRQFVPYARGGCYWLSRRAMEALVQTPFQAHAGAPWFKGNSRMRKLGESRYREDVSIEDVMTGSLLHAAGIDFEPDRRFHDRLRPTLFQDLSLFSNHYVSPRWMYRLERMRSWPANAWRRLFMRAWTLLPSAFPPR